jgi:hypothetical protein
MRSVLYFGIGWGASTLFWLLLWLAIEGNRQ